MSCDTGVLNFKIFNCYSESAGALYYFVLLLHSKQSHNGNYYTQSSVKAAQVHSLEHVDVFLNNKIFQD